jgi:hypothetical protein
MGQAESWPGIRNLLAGVLVDRPTAHQTEGPEGRKATEVVSE